MEALAAIRSELQRRSNRIFREEVGNGGKGGGAVSFPNKTRGSSDVGSLVDVKEQAQMEMQQEVELQQELELHRDVYNEDLVSASLSEWWLDAEKSGETKALSWALLLSQSRPCQRMQSAAVNAHLKAIDKVVFDDNIHLSNRLSTAVDRVNVMLTPLQKYAYYILVGIPPASEVSH